MIVIELTRPTEEPVSIAQAKAWARIERDDEDALVAHLLAAARETVERETGLVIAVRRFRIVVDPMPADGRVETRRAPILSVDALRLYDGTGMESIGDAAAAASAADVLVLPLEARSHAAADIEFTAGLAPSEIPDGLRQAILRIVASSYEARGLVDEAMQPAIVPPFAKAMIAPYRRVRL